jgi:hypothetical protein
VVIFIASSLADGRKWAKANALPPTTLAITE